MFHFVYKTYDDNGHYYYGRHSTLNIDDGYQGSGNWVIASKKLHKKLTTDIIQYAESFEELLILEKHIITENILDINCKNQNNSSCGFAVGNLNPAKSEKERERRRIIGGWFCTEEGKEYSRNNHPTNDPDMLETFKENGRNQWKNIEYKESMSKKQRDFMNTEEQQKRMREQNPAFKEDVKAILSIKSKITQDIRVEKGIHIFQSDEFKIKQKEFDKQTSVRMTENNPMKNLETTRKVNERVTCPHCDIIGSKRLMTTYHFNNCKFNPEYDRSSDTTYAICSQCNQELRKNVITKYHNDKCKVQM